MLDQEDGDLLFLADIEEQAVQVFGLARIEAGGGFIETEQHGLGAHGAGDLEAALGAIGQFARRIVGAVDEARSSPASIRKTQWPRGWRGHRWEN